MSTTIDSRDRAFERLYRRHARDVYRFVLAVVRNPHEAEDVTQTAFLNAYRAYKRGDRPERPQSWLIAIAHNAIRSRRRWTLRRPKEVALDEALLTLAVAPAERTEVADVLHALGDLPVNQREALAMRELEGRTYGEIAETLGVTVSAVEALIARARRTLRAQRATLRGLTAVQLPRSLRNWFEHGDPSGTGLAAKAAIVVAAATVVAGGAGVDSKVADAGHRIGRGAPVRLPVRLEPRRRAAPAPRAVAVPLGHARVAGRRVATQPPAARPPRRPAAPLRRLQRPVRSAVVAAPPRPAAVAAVPAPAPAPAPPAAGAPAAPVVSTAAGSTAAVSTGSVTATVTAVTVPEPPAAAPVPEVPAVPPLTVTVTVPQVPPLGGIK